MNELAEAQHDSFNLMNYKSLVDDKKSSKACKNEKGVKKEV